MEAANFFETLVTVRHSTRRHIPDDELKENVLLDSELCNVSRVPAVVRISNSEKFGM